MTRHEKITTRFSNRSIDLLTAFAILDTTTIGEQVRRAMDAYTEPAFIVELQSVDELSILDQEELHTPADVRLTPLMLNTIGYIAVGFDITYDQVVDAAARSYGEQRLREPGLTDEVARYCLRYISEPSQSPDEG